MVENVENVNKDNGVIEETFQASPDLIAHLKENRSEVEKIVQDTVNSALRDRRETYDKLKAALELEPLSWKEIYKFFLFLEVRPVKVDGNIHGFVDGRWVHIKSPMEMIDLLRSSEATSIFEFDQFPWEHVVRLMDKGLTDKGEYDRTVIDFNNGSLDLIELESRLSSDVSVEDFIGIVRDVFKPGVFSERIPRLSYDWDLLFDSSGCRAHSFIRETVDHCDDRHNLFFFVGNALTSSDRVKKVLSLFGKPRSGKSSVASFISNLFKSSETDLKNFTKDGEFATLPIIGNDLLIFGDVDRDDIVNPAPFKKLTARDRMDVTPKHSNTAKVVHKLEMPYCILTCNDILRLKNDSIKNRFLYAKAENSLEGKPQDDELYIKLAEPVNLSYLLLKSLYVFFTGSLLPDANSRDNLIEINKNAWLYIFNSIFLFDENYESTVDDKDVSRKNEYLTTKCMRVLMEHCMEGLVRNGIVVNHPPMSTKLINNIARYHFNIERSVVGTPARYPFLFNSDNILNLDLVEFLEDTAVDGSTYCNQCANGYGNRCVNTLNEIVNLPGQSSLQGD